MIPVHLIVTQPSEYLQSTLDGLLAQYAPFELRVVDASPNGVVGKMISEQFPSAAILRSARNWSWSDMQNKLLEWAKGDDAVLLIEPGVILSPGCLESMIKTLNGSKDVAIVGPKMLRMYEEHADEEHLHERVQSNRLDGLGVLLKGLLLSEHGMGEEDKDISGQTVVLALRRGALLVRMSALDEVKQDNRWLRDKYVGAEEIDLMLKLSKTGLRTVRDDSAAAYKMSGIFIPKDQEKQPWGFITRFILAMSFLCGKRNRRDRI